MEGEAAYLVIGLGEVVQSQNVVQEGAELRREVLQHETVVVRFFKFAHLFLKAELKPEKEERLLASMMPRSYFVFDFPPWELADCELHQHVEQGPQVVMTTHFLEMGTRCGGFK